LAYINNKEPERQYKEIKMKLLITAIGVFISWIAIVQTTKIIIFDSKTKKSVLYATVCFEGLGTEKKQYAVISINSEITTSAKEKSQIAYLYYLCELKRENK